MNLSKFFNPSSIAIVGVSQNPLKVGHLVAKNMIAQGYKDELFFVHPTDTSLLGRQVYPNLKSIGRDIDLVIYAIPGDIALKTMEEVKEVHCKNVLLFAAGFKENHNAEGAEREKLLHEKIASLDVTLLGPNCLGFINTRKGINATFLKQTAPTGNIGIISQSGALGSAFVDSLTAHHNLGISYFLSLGNKSVIDESDCLEFLGNDADTKVIGVYLEDVVNGNKFHETLARVSLKKPVIILKGGRTSAGSQAALSHTGSMVGDDAVFEAICKQSAAIRVNGYTEFVAILKLYSFNRLPASEHILVLSNAGGMGVLFADELVQSNLKLVTVSEDTKNKLSKAFEQSKKISVHNPIDLLGDASAFDYQKAIELTVTEKDIGAVVVLLTPQANTQIMDTAKVLAEAQKNLEVGDKIFYKPIYPVFMGASSVSEAEVFFEKQSMASFYKYDLMPTLFSYILERKNYLESVKTLPQSTADFSMKAHVRDIQTILIENSGKDFLNQYDSLKVLDNIGLQTAKTYLVTSEEDTKQVLQLEGYPLVAKISSTKITHKTEVKGVITGLNTWEELMDAYTHLSSLSENKKECYLQHEYGGHEIILGAKRDTTFGVVVMVGIGGIYAELLKEVIQIVNPFSYEYFLRELHKTKVHKLIEGYRKLPPLDTEKLYDVAVKLALLMKQFPEIKEIDINPLISTPEEAVIVDGRIII
jgi:acetyltransferase